MVEKIKNFIWSLIRNILPIRCNLRKKGDITDQSFPFCHNFLEDNQHLFIYCDFVKSALFSTPLGVRVLVGIDVVDWIFVV